MEILTAYKIPVGWLSDHIVLWLKQNAAAFFAFARHFFGTCLDATYAFFMHPPIILVFILLFGALLFPSNWALSYIRRFFLTLFLVTLFMLDSIFFDTQPILTCLALIGISGLVLLRRHKQFKDLSLSRALGAFCLAIIAFPICFKAVAFIPPSFIFIALIAIFAWFMQERWSIVLLTILGFMFVINQGYWQDTMETLTILFWSCLFCLGLGVPLGILAAHNPKFYRFMQPILDLMQTLPAFVYLIPALFFFRIGMVPGLVATLVFVLPTPIRLTQAGIASTPKILLEAAQAFGANKHKVLWKVELPHALPEIRASMTQTIMLSLSMVVITATVGGSGLGVKVYRALQTGNVALGFEAGCVIVVVAIVLERVFKLRKI